MPFIQIKSLPMKSELNISKVICGITTDFSHNVGIELCHIHTTWEFYKPGHYAKGNQTHSIQPEKNFPIIVEIHSPDINDDTTIQLMLESVAKSIASRAEFPINNIFINHLSARSGHVFDDGEVVYW